MPLQIAVCKLLSKVVQIIKKSVFSKMNSKDRNYYKILNWN